MEITIKLANTGETHNITAVTLNYRYSLIMGKTEHDNGVITCKDAKCFDNRNEEVTLSDIAHDYLSVTGLETESGVDWIALEKIELKEDGVCLEIVEKGLEMMQMKRIALKGVTLDLTYPQYIQLKEIVRSEDRQDTFLSALDNNGVNRKLVKHLLDDPDRCATVSEQFYWICSDKVTGEDEFRAIKEVIQSQGGLGMYEILCKNDELYRIACFPEQASMLQRRLTEMEDPAGVPVSCEMEDLDGEVFDFKDAKDMSYADPYDYEEDLC